MSKKLIIIIVGLFILQFGIFIFVEGEIKPEEVLRRNIDDFQSTYDIFLDQFGQPYETSIDLSNSDLYNVPQRVYTFENMESIDLSNNNLTIFPYELLKLPNLRTIRLNDNQIKNLDFSGVEFSNLEVLELQNNQIIGIRKLENLKNLEKIDLTKNELSKFPNITNDALRFAYLGFNKIQKLEGRIGNGLVKLILTSNEIATIDLEITGDEILTGLNLEKNYALKSFPYRVLNFSSLKELNLSSCSIASMNEQPLMINKSLEKLYLKENRLFEFELSNIDFPNLKELDLSDNQLTKVKIINHNIEGLLLSSNRLKHENLLLKMNSLSELILTNNHLSTLPKSSVDAPNLLYLNIFDNEMTAQEILKTEERLIND